MDRFLKTMQPEVTRGPLFQGTKDRTRLGFEGTQAPAKTTPLGGKTDFVVLRVLKPNDGSRREWLARTQTGDHDGTLKETCSQKVMVTENFSRKIRQFDVG